MKKLILLLTSMIAISAIAQPTTGTVYNKTPTHSYINKFITMDPLKSQRGNMNYIAQELSIDTTQVTFWYNSDNDMQFLIYININPNSIYKRIGWQNDAVIRYDSYEQMMNDNTYYQDSSNVSPTNFMPYHVANTEISKMMDTIRTKPYKWNVYTKTQVDSIKGTINVPAQLNLSGSGSSSITGSYPNLTVNTPTIPTNNNQLANGAGYLTSESDGSTSNEIQALSINGNTLSLSVGGGSVALPAVTTYTAGTGVSITSGTITNTAPDQVVAITGTTGISATGTYPNFTIGRTSSTFSTPSRSLSTTGSNNTFTISARESFVSYSINFSAALTLTTSNGQVDLDYSTNGGSNWVNVSSVSQAFGVSITITTNQTLTLCGKIPAGALVRINRVQNTNVTTTIVRQQEVAD